jgi:hypothetical protein
MEGVEEAQTEEGKVEKGQTGSSTEKGKECEVDTWMRGSQEAQTEDGKVEEGQTGGSAGKDKGREAGDHRGWRGVVEQVVDKCEVEAGDDSGWGGVVEEVV